MATLTIRNLTNSPFDIEGGHRLPDMGEITAEFSDYYASLLRASPGVEVIEAPEQLASEPDIDDLRAEAEKLGIDVDKRWGMKRLEAEIAKAKA